METNKFPGSIPGSGEPFEKKKLKTFKVKAKVKLKQGLYSKEAIISYSFVTCDPGFKCYREGRGGG